MPKYKVGDKLSADSTVINIIAITPRNYVVEYIKGMNIGQESLWDILGEATCGYLMMKGQNGKSLTSEELKLIEGC